MKNAPISPAYLCQLLAPAKPGESMTHDGKLQLAAMKSRNRFDGLYVTQAGNLYDVMPHPDNAQQFALYAVTGGMRSDSYLSWGHVAFNQALEDGYFAIHT